MNSLNDSIVPFRLRFVSVCVCVHAQNFTIDTNWICHIRCEKWCDKQFTARIVAVIVSQFIYCIRTHALTHTIMLFKSNLLPLHCCWLHRYIKCCMFWWFYCFSSFHFYNEYRHRSCLCRSGYSKSLQIWPIFRQMQTGITASVMPFICFENLISFVLNDDNPFIGFT